MREGATANRDSRRLANFWHEMEDQRDDAWFEQVFKERDDLLHSMEVCEPLASRRAALFFFSSFRGAFQRPRGLESTDG